MKNKICIAVWILIGFTSLALMVCLPLKAQLSAATAFADKIEESVLVGTTWKWQQTLYNNDQKAVPGDPSHYTITFQPDGTLGIRADCNRAGGKYTLQKSALTIEVTHSTRAACPPDSLEQTFLKNLNAAAISFMREGHLYIDLRYDTGTMKFAK